MFGHKKTEEESIKMVRLCNVATLVDAETIMARLKSAGIPCYRMESGAGSVFTIKAGMSLEGYDIFVSERDTERAVQIMN